MTIGFTGYAWIHPFSSSWNISTTFSTNRRNDTGHINSTPRAITAPVLRLQDNCSHTIRIPVVDPDNDIVRCRWAEGSECAGVCQAFPGAVLDSTSCSITYHTNQVVGYRVAAIMIEDFIPESTSPLSSTALQFLVLVVDSNMPCFAAPQFVSPTIPAGTCVAIPPGETYHTRLVADSGSLDTSIIEIQTASPSGMQKSELFHEGESDTVSTSYMLT